MGRGNPLLALAAGIGTGLVDGKESERKRRIEDEDRQLHRDQVALQMRQASRAEQDQIALRDAARPAAVEEGAGGALRPATMDDRDVGQAGETPVGLGGAFRVNGTTYGDRTAADSAASQYNAPTAVAGRITSALTAQGRPTEAIQLQQATTQLTAQQQKLAREAKEEGYHDAAQAMLSGDAQAVFQTFNRQGATKLKEPPQVAPRVVEIPGVGKLNTFDYTGTLVGPDGVERKGTINSHEFNAKLIPYKEQLELARKGSDSHAKAEKLLSDAANAADKLRLQGDATTAKIELAREKAAGGDKPPPGYRKTPDGNLQPIPGGPADAKVQGQFNQDTAALTGSMAGFDRLASAANEVLRHPGLGGITGWRGKLPNAPGSDAANAEALLGTLKSQVGFGVLQDMRNNSKTGGALGSVSDAEGKRLEANLAALDKSQSIEQYKENLQKIIDYSEQAKDRMRASFNMRHGDKPVGANQGAAPSSQVVRVTSPAEVQKLPRGTRFVGPDGRERVVP